MTASALYRLYRVGGRRTRSAIVRLVTRLEGGEMHSPTLRRIFADYHGVEVGLYSYGCFVPGDIAAGTTIGRYCSFAAGVVIFNANHPLDRASLHPFFYNPRLGVVTGETIARGRLTVGHGAWIGRNALVTPAVRNIGDGAVVGAGAVVTKDVPAYAVVAGSPARLIRRRFPASVQRTVEDSRWWERSIDELRGDLEAFLRPASSWCQTPEAGRTLLTSTI